MENIYTPPDHQSKHNFKKKKGKSAEQNAFLILPIITALAFFIALPNLVEEQGMSGNFKILLLAVGALTVSVGVQHAALKHGTFYTSRKSITAGLISVASIILIGFAMSIATIHGIGRPEIAKYKVELHNIDLTDFVYQQDRLASKADTLAPALLSIANDLSSKAKSEQEYSSISGSKHTGRGTITIKFEELATQAATYYKQTIAGNKEREDLLKEANKNLSKYSELIGDGNSSVWDRWSELQELDNLVGQSAARISESAPVDLVRQYVERLREGVSIPGRPEVEGRIDDILGSYADQLEKILTQEVTIIERKKFPLKPTVSDTLDNIDRVLPVALIIFAIDLIFPMVLWIFEYLRLVYRKDGEQQDGGESAAVVTPLPNGHDRRRSSNRPSSRR